MKPVVAFSLIFLLASPFTAAYGCDGNTEYEQCLSLGPYKDCKCFPKVPDGVQLPKTPIPVPNPYPDVLNTVAGVVNGNVAQISQGIGGLVIKGSCIGCAAVVQTLPEGDKAFVEQVVGRGWIVYLSSGGDPVVVLVDVATSAPKVYSLSRPPTSPSANFSPAELAKNKPGIALRRSKIYRSDNAVCAVLADDKKHLMVAWVEPPILIHGKDNTASIFPAVDLKEGDTVEFHTSNACPGVPKGQAKLTTGALSLEYTRTEPGLATEMKVFFLGQVAR